MITVEQYAEKIGKTPQAVRWQCKHGKLAPGYKATKVGGTWIITATTGQDTKSK